MLDNLGNKTDRVIMSIIWFTPEQLRLNRRFVSGFLIESDATFNKESRRLLLHNLIGINNYGKTYLALQLFATNKGARVFKKLEDVWNRFIFYDCPRPAVLARDFAAGLTVAVARSGIKRKEAARRAKEMSREKGKGRADFDDEFEDIVPIRGLEDVVAKRRGL